MVAERQLSASSRSVRDDQGHSTVKLASTSRSSLLLLKYIAGLLVNVEKCHDMSKPHV